ncbi:hypothetical protein D7B24_000641 [Verticillium nonalfalfae]|uniref:Uncharacterized protein n=1 Tax=Verticillium nonalfalfae TaxID=1051616 RepID=A0A3M9YHR6_9PEZI|nr:uncharacterized protein D7B24_000641 [Verticillium nonalfalfae]RNJ59924.1 hypothetical protein D7B24_000641 [Verticillium nonalfalfae]
MPLYQDIETLKQKLGGAYASVLVILHERQRERERLAMEAKIKAKKEAEDKAQKEAEAEEKAREEVEAAAKKEADEATKKERQQRREALRPPRLQMSLIMKVATHLSEQDDDEYDDAYLSTAELAEGTSHYADNDWTFVQRPFRR